MGSAPEPTNPTFFATAADFRAWLRWHHRTASLVWVGYYKKATGKPSVTWAETVDEALCYGWIDGVRRSVDAESYTVRFTPRKPRSVWSRRNIERVAALEAAGRMRQAGREAFAHKDAHADSGYAVGDRPAALPRAMTAEFKRHPDAWAFYAAQPAGYHKQTTAWVTGAKREATRRRRLALLIDDSASGRRVRPFRRG